MRHLPLADEGHNMLGLKSNTPHHMAPCLAEEVPNM